VKAAVLIAFAAAIAFAQTPRPHLIKADIESMMKELSNWGRWGKNDQKGTVNLITPEVRRQAAALVKDGVSVSLSHNTDSTYGVKMSPPVDGQFNMDEQTCSSTALRIRISMRSPMCSTTARCTTAFRSRR